jgi:hypothetical protein
MNAKQSLEVATKVFANQDEEAKQEANCKMKKKVDLLTVALTKESGGPWSAGHGRGRGNPHGWQTVSSEWPQPRGELR